MALRAACGLVAALACSQALAQPAEPPAPEDPPAAVDSPPPPDQQPELVPPEMIEFVEAVLPPGAPAPEAERKVVLSVEVLADGTVGEVLVLQSGGDEALAQAALEAGRRLRFRPATWGGQPTPVKVRFTYRFAPPPPPPPPEPGEDEVAAPAPPPVVDLVGTVLERGTRRPLGGVAVQLDPGAEPPVEAVTGPEGRFELAAGPGRHALAFFLATHFPAQLEAEVREGERTHVKVYLLARPTDPYSTVVRARRPRREVTRTTLEHREVTRVAGTFGEPFRVIEALPGLQRVPYTGGFLIVRGANPRNTGVFLDGHEIPLLYHFVVGSAVFNADLVSSIDFSPGNWSVRHGRRLGGLVEVRTSDERPDRRMGQVDTDVIDSGLLGRAPLAEGLDGFFALRVANLAPVVFTVPEIIEAIDVDTAPDYLDYQVGLNADLPGRWEGRLLAYGSRDGFEQRGAGEGAEDANNAPEDDEESTLAIGFHRLLARAWRPLPAEGRLDVSVALGLDVVTLESGGNHMIPTGYHLESRADATVKPASSLTLEAGLDVVLRRFAVEFSGPQPPAPWEFPVPAVDIRHGPRLDVITELDQLMPAAYVQADWEPVEGVHLVPGVRVDVFAGGSAEDVTVDPRFVARWELLDWLVLKGGVGLFHQPPEAFQAANVLGDQGLGIPAALHVSGGAEVALGEVLELDVAGYSISRWGLMRVVRDVTVSSGGDIGQQIFDDTREERSVGLEVLVRHRPVGPFFGWIAYTLSRTERRDATGLPWRRHALDQPHVLTAVGSLRLGDGWELGARVRLVSGNPTTPIEGVFYDADRDAYRPIRGEPRSGRLPAFFQLDLRVDKQWTFETWILNTYLDLLNATYRDNAEFVRYSYDFSQKEMVGGLPILPSIGVKGRF